MDTTRIVLTTKNTFLEVEERSATEARSASLPRSWKVATTDELCPSDESTASFTTAQGLQRLSDCILSDNDDELPSTRQPSLSSCWDVLSPCPASPNVHHHAPWGPCWSLIETAAGQQEEEAKQKASEDEEEGAEALMEEEVESPRTRSPRRRGRGRRSRASFVEFGAVLDKRDGSTHGIDIDWSSGVHLLIEEIKTPGLVSDWNLHHPQQPINVGNCIVEVNGVRGKAEELLTEMKKDQLLKIRVRSKRQQKNNTSSNAEEAASPPSSPQFSPARRTALSSHAPLFQPGAVSARVASVTGSSTGGRGAWAAPESMKPEFKEVMQAFNNALASCLPAGWWMEGSSASVCISAVALSLSSASILAKTVQQTVQSTIAKFPGVILVGHQSRAFHAVGQNGFRFTLCALQKDRSESACWDQLSKGSCPRGCLCTWHHPQESELLEVQVMLNPVAPQQVVCVPVLSHPPPRRA